MPQPNHEWMSQGDDEAKVESATPAVPRKQPGIEKLLTRRRLLGAGTVGIASAAVVTGLDTRSAKAASSNPVELHVDDFGADPTGTKDSTDAVNNTIKAVKAQSLNGGIVRFGPGAYTIGSLGAGIKVRSDVTGSPWGVMIEGASMGATSIQVDPKCDYGIDIGTAPGEGGIDVGYGVRNLSIGCNDITLAVPDALSALASAVQKDAEVTQVSLTTSVTVSPGDVLELDPQVCFVVSQQVTSSHIPVYALAPAKAVSSFAAVKIWRHGDLIRMSSGSQRCYLEHVGFGAFGSGNAGCVRHALFLAGGYIARFGDLTMSHGRGVGIYANHSYDSQFHQGWITGFTAGSIIVDGATLWKVTQMLTEATNGWAIHAVGLSGAQITDSSLDYSYQGGLWLDGGFDVSVSDVNVIGAGFSFGTPAGSGVALPFRLSNGNTASRLKSVSMQAGSGLNAAKAVIQIEGSVVDALIDGVHVIGSPAPLSKLLINSLSTRVLATENPYVDSLITSVVSDPAVGALFGQILTALDEQGILRKSPGMDPVTVASPLAAWEMRMESYATGNSVSIVHNQAGASRTAIALTPNGTAPVATMPATPSPKILSSPEVAQFSSGTLQALFGTSLSQWTVSFAGSNAVADAYVTLGVAGYPSGCIQLMRKDAAKWYLWISGAGYPAAAEIAINNPAGTSYVITVWCDGSQFGVRANGSQVLLISKTAWGVTPVIPDRLQLLSAQSQAGIFSGAALWGTVLSPDQMIQAERSLGYYAGLAI